MSGDAFVAGVAPFLAATAPWFRATVVFFAAVDVLAGCLTPVAVAGRVGFTTVVPDDVVDEFVLVLSLRSFCRVTGRETGDWTGLVSVLPARLVAPLSCEGGLLSFADAAPFAVRARELSARLAGPLSGLDGLSGDTGRESLSGEPRRGEWGYVFEFSDLGERILESAPRTFCETTREVPVPPAASLARRLGFFSPSAGSPAGAFSLSEYTPSWLRLWVSKVGSLVSGIRYLCFFVLRD